MAWGLHGALVPEELRPNVVRFVQGMFGERARRLGLLPRAGDSEDTRLLRMGLVGLVADLGEDADLRAEARRLAVGWLEDRKSLDPTLLGTLLPLAALDGDPDLFGRFLAEARATRDSRDLDDLLWTLGAFRNPECHRRALDLILSGAFDPRRALVILWAGMGHPATLQASYDFVKANFDKLAALLPEDFMAGLPMVAAGFSDEAHRADAEAFFKDRVGRFTGAPRNLAMALERIQLAEALGKAQKPGVEAFLKRY
jgi:alanyl aminopeptidase